ncbi:hypothetical protein TNCV_4657601, partial [Trichonephila clavipes]
IIGKGFSAGKLCAFLGLPFLSTAPQSRKLKTVEATENVAQENINVH